MSHNDLFTKRIWLIIGARIVKILQWVGYELQPPVFVTRQGSHFLFSPKCSEPPSGSYPIFTHFYFPLGTVALLEYSCNINGRHVTNHAKNTVGEVEVNLHYILTSSGGQYLVNNILHLPEFEHRIFQIVVLLLHRMSYRGLPNNKIRK
jgi:hypothetical protein